MTAKEFYSKRALKHQLRRAIRRDSKYYEDVIIEMMEEYAALKNIPSSQVIMPHALTAENGAKALLIGEFHENYTYTTYNEDTDEDIEFTAKVPVSWTTIKAIYKMIVQKYAA